MQPIPFILFALTLGAEPGYVDPATCATCHRVAAEGYAKSGMARSFGTAQQAPPGQFRHTIAEQDYVVSTAGGKSSLRRSVAGSDVLDATIDYWIGSGNHARSYLTRGANGKLTELPLTWYPRDRKWAMSPGYDVAFHAGFTRKITYGCIFCHAGYPNLLPDAEQHEAGWKLPEQLGTGIDCQRCHGPGLAHVTAAQQGLAVDLVRAAIVNPKRLNTQRGMEVCLQCHLETTSLHLPGFIRKYDRAVFSYRPGQPLEDYILHFNRADAKDHSDGVEFVSQAARTMMSACFLKSKGGLTCMTCHNPHDIPRGVAATRHYANACKGCHAATPAGHPASQDCVSCHMPKRIAVDALNTTVTDHFIRKRPAAEPKGVRAEQNDSSIAAYRGEVVPSYPANVSDLYLAAAQVKHRANIDAGLPKLDALVNQQKPAQGEFYLDLSEAWKQAGQLDKSAFYARQAAERMPKNWRAWLAAGDIERAAALAPDEPQAWQALGEMHARQGKFADALKAFRAAIATDPEFAEGHNNVGTTLLRMGDSGGSEKELREAVRLRPESSAMQVNLATVLARRGAMTEARRRFELALKMNPQFAEGYSAFGVALAANKDWILARLQFDQAIKLNPKAPVTHHNLGVVLLELREEAGALIHFQVAVDLDPTYTAAKQQLAALQSRKK